MVKTSIPDRYYEQKLVQGSITPTWDYMTDTEANAVVNGRYRGDGRRLDQWISDEPMGIILDRSGGLAMVKPKVFQWQPLSSPGARQLRLAVRFKDAIKRRTEGRW